MITIKVDGKKIEVDEGKILIEVLQENEIYVPTLCYVKNLTPISACRLCTVEIVRKGRSRFVTACNYPITETIDVKTNSEKVIKIRKRIIELLLARCPDVKILQDLAKQYGIEKIRYPIEHENCILCGLCVRACSEIAGVHAINFSNRGLDKKVSTPFEIAYDLCTNCNECIKVCPTGAVELMVKKYTKLPELLASGHRLCAGCAESIIIRQILHSTDKAVVVSNATGCFEIATSIYPFTAWNVPWIHTAFENAAATISGVEACYKVLKRKGEIEDNDIKFIALAGDGGTYDIGIQALSGAAERGHDFLYICLNNEAYMNTGIQRSSATAKGASTTTSPSGSVIPGKKEYPKDLTEIMVAHKIPYIAQASPAFYNDLISKANKAFSIQGPKFMNILSPCPRGWRFPSEKTIDMARKAVETCIWPLYEVKNTNYRLTSLSRLIAEDKKEKVPIKEYLALQGRFSHLFEPNFKHVINEIQENVDLEWERLKKKSGY